MVGTSSSRGSAPAIGTSAKQSGPRPMVPIRDWAAPELDARLRPNSGAVNPSGPARAGRWGERLWLSAFAQLPSHDFCCSPEWFISKMSITLCRERICVTEKPSNDREAHAARNKLRCMCVAVVMYPIVVDFCISENRLPELLKIDNMLSLRPAGENKH